MRKIGVDLGGTKIEVAVLDDQDEIIWRERVATPKGDYAGTIIAMVDLIKRAEADCGRVESIGVGTPGAISPATGLIKNANSVVLNDKPLKKDLEARLGRQIFMANDANCLALSETRGGAANGATSVFGVILGTGVGGGLVINGQVHTGANAIAGEWGHNPLPWVNEERELPGPQCWCGLRGCIEQWLSGPAFERDFAQHASLTESAERDHVPAKEIIQRADNQDKIALAAIERYEQRLARALAHMINMIDPEVIVLGGGMSNVDRLYEQVPRQWADYIFSDHVATRLVAPVFGDSSGVRGAAFLPELGGRS
ncbi:MAG TPA: ROK family protein [Halothiobacillaceae bacterium]|nr:ROK family protein [Halothiobacillaceae bacterium]